MKEAEHEPDRKHDRRHPVRRRQAEEGGSSGGRWTKGAVRRRSRERAAERLRHLQAPGRRRVLRTLLPGRAGGLQRNQRADNPLGLLPAWKLYTKPAYRKLAKHFGIDNLYILSAGWGLVAAYYLLPCYNITFSASVEGYQRRRKRDCGYHDFAMLPTTISKHVVFLGEEDYVPHFCRLTDGVARRTVVFNAHMPPPPAPGCELRPYPPLRWHYECAKKLVSGEFTVR